MHFLSNKKNCEEELKTKPSHPPPHHKSIWPSTHRQEDGGRAWGPESQGSQPQGEPGTSDKGQSTGAEQQ